MAVWLTVGFFEVVEARVEVGGMQYSNTFTCIPASVPLVPAAGKGAFLPSGMPLVVAIPPGQLLERFKTAMKKRELLPYIEVRPVSRVASDVLRIHRARITSISPQMPGGSCHVTIAADQ
jgi:hypothetical protein